MNTSEELYRKRGVDEYYIQDAVNFKDLLIILFIE